MKRIKNFQVGVFSFGCVGKPLTKSFLARSLMVPKFKWFKGQCHNHDLFLEALDNTQIGEDFIMSSTEIVSESQKNSFLITHAQQVQPAMYNDHEIIKTNHAPAIVHNSEDTLEIAEITRKKMNDKMKDPEFTEMLDAHTVVQARCLELEAELSKLRDKVQKDDHT
ncbi:hypothetical protein Tco_0846640 [Tanacetum coccineum]